MKLFHTYFSLLRTSDLWSPVAALSIFGLCVLASTPHAGVLGFLLRHSDIVNSMCCILGAILVGYTVVVGMIKGPNEVEDNATVEVENNTTESVAKRYLKI